MTALTLTRFNVNPRDYSWQDDYVACLDANAGINCHSITSYMAGLMKQMERFANEPAAWSFSQWKRSKSTNNEGEHWLRATAVVLEYRTKGDAAQVAADLHARATDLGYCHILMDSLSRKGNQTITIVLPLTESINKEQQYARLASVLMEELGQYRAAEGNMAHTHLIHVDKDCRQCFVEGAVIAPRAKIKQTETLYQNMDPKRFEASGPSAGIQIAQPTITSHDGLFEFPANAEERAQLDANELLAKLGVVLDQQDSGR